MTTVHASTFLAHSWWLWAGFRVFEDLSGGFFELGAFLGLVGPISSRFSGGGDEEVGNRWDHHSYQVSDAGTFPFLHDEYFAELCNLFVGGAGVLLPAAVDDSEHGVVVDCDVLSNRRRNYQNADAGADGEFFRIPFFFTS